jgi:hypothetical protein
MHQTRGKPEEYPRKCVHAKNRRRPSEERHEDNERQDQQNGRLNLNSGIGNEDHEITETKIEQMKPN